ncbi:hypothetical protein ACWXVQ_00210 [Mycoplasma sp. 527]
MKSSKLLIALCGANVGTIVAAAGISIYTVQQSMPRNVLIQKIDQYEKELKTNISFNENQKTKIKQAIEAAKAFLSGTSSQNLNFENAIAQLVNSVEEIKQNPNTEEMDIDKLKRFAKKSYNNKLQEAKQLQILLSYPRYEAIKSRLDLFIYESTKNINDDSLKSDYDEAKQKLEVAIKEAIQAKQEIDTLENTKNDFNDKVKEAKELSNKLLANKYYDVKAKLDLSIKEITNNLNNKSKKHDYDEAKIKLQMAIDEASKLKEQIDLEEKNLLEAKNKYEEKISEGDKLSKELDGDLYKDIKQKFDESFKKLKDQVTNKSTKQQYDSATKLITELIEKTKNDKKTIDDKIQHQLEEQQQIFYNKLSNDFLDIYDVELAGDKYKDIKDKLQEEVQAIVNSVSDSSTIDDFKEAIKKLEKAFDNARKAKIELDKQTTPKVDAKKDYEKKLKEAEQLSSSLKDTKYENVKKKLDDLLNQIKAKINDKTTDEEYKNTTKELEAAIESANNEKKEIDKKEILKQKIDEAKAEFKKLETEITEFIQKSLTKPEQQDLKSKLETELNKQKQNIEKSNLTTKKINAETKKLKNFFEQIKRDSQKIDEKVENLTSAQKVIVDKINDKSILNQSSLTETIKKDIIDIYKGKSKIVDEKVRNFFGYIKLKKDILELSEKSSSKKNKIKKLGKDLFAKEFMDMIKSKDVVYAGVSKSKNGRKALCLELKEDGTVVLPFKFNGHEKIYEIVLFKSDELKNMLKTNPSIIE